MRKDPIKDPVKTNNLLGKQPSIGPIPADQIIPWTAITIISYALTEGFFGMGIPVFLVINFWLCLTWWLCTGRTPYKFTDKFVNPPGKDWCNAATHHLHLIPENRPPYLRNRHNDRKNKIKSKPEKFKTPEGTTAIYMPLQNHIDLLSIIEIEGSDDRSAYAYLLNKGKNGSDEYQIIFGFKLDGIHPNIHHTEIAQTIEDLKEALKELPPGEKLTFHCKLSNDTQQEHYLENLADNCKTPTIALMTRSQQMLTQELTKNRKRQTWETTVFASWTFNEKTQEKSKSPLDKVVSWIIRKSSDLAGSFTGNKAYYKRKFYTHLFLQAYERGFLPWELLLSTKAGLKTKPMNDRELWEHLWHEFNDSPCPREIPQKLILRRTKDDCELKEIVNTHKSAITVAIEGTEGRSSCPEHRGSRDTIWFPGLKRQKGVLTIEEQPEGWSNSKTMLKYLYDIFCNPYIGETEIVTELTAANQAVVKDSLQRQAKQSKASKTRAIEKGQGFSAKAESKQRKSFEAQMKLVEGSVAINCATTIIINRNTKQELSQASNILCKSFGTAKVIRERNIAWKLWLESLPVTTHSLLANSSLISERRLTADQETAIGLMPLVKDTEIDKEGVEFISKSSMPIHTDIVKNKTARAIITAISGGGKSVLAAQYAIWAMQNNIPVIGMDISMGNTSTFEAFTEALGSKGAYYDITKTSYNLMQPPDLRNFDSQTRDSRINQWIDSLRLAIETIAMGKINNPRLAQKVGTLTTLALKKFINDPDIIDRYNTAFKKGWKSKEWQQMPTLKDFLKFCTKERLNLKDFTKEDKIALAQITTQCTALLESPLGNAIGKPSSFSPTPMFKFFALSGLTNEQEQAIMSVVIMSACTSAALSYPKSLFIGDEISILFSKKTFADMVGELFAAGRKAGIAALLIGQDIDSVLNASSGSKILQNTDYRITGRITEAGANTWMQRMNYPAHIIRQNTSDSFKPDRATLSTAWLIESQNTFHQVRYYPSPLALASVANEQDEIAARDRIMKKHNPKTLKERLIALNDFAEQYKQTITNRLTPDSIEPNQKDNITHIKQKRKSA